MTVTIPTPNGAGHGRRPERDDLPGFKPEAFAKWLRKWKDSERLEWGDMAERSGLNRSTLQFLAAGAPNSKGAVRTAKGGIPTDPRVNTLARLAHGLGLELAYVLSKAGLTSEHEGRWANFTSDERATIARALAVTGEAVSPASQHLAEELRASLTNDDNNEGEE